MKGASESMHVHSNKQHERKAKRLSSGWGAVHLWIWFLVCGIDLLRGGRGIGKQLFCFALLCLLGVCSENKSDASSSSRESGPFIYSARFRELHNRSMGREEEEEEEEEDCIIELSWWLLAGHDGCLLFFCRRIGTRSLLADRSASFRVEINAFIVRLCLASVWFIDIQEYSFF